MITILRGRSVRVLWLLPLTQRAINGLSRTRLSRRRMIGSFPLLSHLYRQGARPATHRKTEKERKLAERRGGGGRSIILLRRESLVLYKSFNTLYPYPAYSTRGVTNRCRLSWLTNSALVYEPKCGGQGMRGLSQWVRPGCTHGAQINFGDLTPYLTYDSTSLEPGLGDVLKRKTIMLFFQFLSSWQAASSYGLIWGRFSYGGDFSFRKWLFVDILRNTMETMLCIYFYKRLILTFKNANFRLICKSREMFIKINWKWR